MLGHLSIYDPNLLGNANIYELTSGKTKVKGDFDNGKNIVYHVK